MIQIARHLPADKKIDITARRRELCFTGLGSMPAYTSIPATRLRLWQTLRRRFAAVNRTKRKQASHPGEYPVTSAEGFATEEENNKNFRSDVGRIPGGLGPTGEIVRHFPRRGHLGPVGLRGGADSVSRSCPSPIRFLIRLPPNPEICLRIESIGIQPAPPPRSRKDFTERGNIWGSTVHASDRPTTGRVFGHVWTREARRSTGCHRTGVCRPVWRRRPHFAGGWNSMADNWHAAAIGFDNRSVLIPGRGGSGKSSTSSHACSPDSTSCRRLSGGGPDLNRALPVVFNR